MLERDETPARPIGRREWLNESLRLVVGSAALAAVGCLNSCAPSAPPFDPDTLRVSLDQLPHNQRVVVVHGELPVELLRTSSGVRARSLMCRHWGCTVEWTPEERIYKCPCHEAHYAESGEVLSGPPTEGLRELALRQEGTEIVVDLRSRGPAR